MMGDIVSLKLRRKHKAQVEKESAAAKRAQDGKRLDGHKRDE